MQGAFINQLRFKYFSISGFISSLANGTNSGEYLMFRMMRALSYSSSDRRHIKYALNNEKYLHRKMEFTLIHRMFMILN